MAFDTSAAHCAAALLSGGAVVESRFAPMAKGQAEALMPMIQDLLGAAACDLADLDALAVGIGPGNFTGIRVGVAAARGLALSLRIPALGVSTFELAGAASLPNSSVTALIQLPFGRNGDASVFHFLDDGWRIGAPFVQSAPFSFDTVAPNGQQVQAFVGADATAFAQASPLDHADHRPWDLPADRWASEMARLASARYARASEWPRPAPLYARPADAAPPREAPPAIVP